MRPFNPAHLAIGSVQFGLDYGISNSSGRTGIAEVKKILDLAKNNGIDTIDTAYAYGESEQILGNQELKTWNIISKFPAPGKMSVADYFNESLRRLRIDKLYGFMAHNAAILTENPGLWEDLTKLKSTGRVQKIGYSLYAPDELESLVEMGMIPDIIQIPFNILDTRFERKFEYLKSLKVEIHTRSTFLQGLFFMPPDELSDFFNPIKPFLRQLSEELPILSDRAAMLVYHSVTNENISKVVMGVNNSIQLAENLTALKSISKIPELNPINTPENILNPSKWPA